MQVCKGFGFASLRTLRGALLGLSWSPRNVVRCARVAAFSQSHSSRGGGVGAVGFRREVGVEGLTV